MDKWRGRKLLEEAHYTSLQQGNQSINALFPYNLKKIKYEYFVREKSLLFLFTISQACEQCLEDKKHSLNDC